MKGEINNFKGNDKIEMKYQKMKEKEVVRKKNEKRRGRMRETEKKVGRGNKRKN